MPYIRVTSNVAKSSVDIRATSTALAEKLESCWGVPKAFMMVELNLDTTLSLQLNDEPTAYVQARTIDNIDAEHNPKTITEITNTVAEHLKVPAARIYVVLEGVKVGNWGANGTTVIPPGHQK